MVPLNKVFPCGTYEKYPRVPTVTGISAVSVCKNNLPFSGRTNASIKRMRVVFPFPVVPTIAVGNPGRNVALKRSITFRSS